MKAEESDRICPHSTLFNFFSFVNSSNSFLNFSPIFHIIMSGRGGMSRNISYGRGGAGRSSSFPSFNPPHSYQPRPPTQAISRVNSPPQHPETSSHPQSNKKSIQLVAEVQGTWPTTILIDQRSRAKVKTSNPLHYGRNKCPTIPDEVCEALNTFKANKKG